MAKYRIVIDYGHGGSKSGACVDGTQEKILNQLLGQKIMSALKVLSGEDTVQVMLTRDTDYDIPISVRLQLINLHHKETPIDLVCSVHYNAATTPRAQGFEVYYSENSAKGRLFSQSIAEEVGKLGVKLRNGGFLTTAKLGRRLAMIHKTAPPSVLIEGGYLTNSFDLEQSNNAEYRSTLAGSIAAGIWSALKNGGN